MQNMFPELKMQHGTTNGIAHVWLVDELGNVVDPCASKFKGRIRYSKNVNNFNKQWRQEWLTKPQTLLH